MVYAREEIFVNLHFESAVSDFVEQGRAGRSGEHAIETFSLVSERTRGAAKDDRNPHVSEFQIVNT
jgi:hypothetical protein